MRYWWVNTFRYELAGGYLLSPKCNANGGLNPFYESMRVCVTAEQDSRIDCGSSNAPCMLAKIGRIFAVDASRRLELCHRASPTNR